MAEYGLPSSDELVVNTAKYFNEYDCVLMANHGVIIGSKTLEDAYLKLEMAEEYAKTIIYSNILGEFMHGHVAVLNNKKSTFFEVILQYIQCIFQELYNLLEIQCVCFCSLLILKI